MIIVLCESTRTERCGVVGSFVFRVFRAFGEATIVNQKVSKQSKILTPIHLYRQYSTSPSYHYYYKEVYPHKEGYYKGYYVGYTGAIKGLKGTYYALNTLETKGNPLSKEDAYARDTKTIDTSVRGSYLER